MLVELATFGIFIIGALATYLLVSGLFGGGGSDRETGRPNVSLVPRRGPFRWVKVLFANIIPQMPREVAGIEQDMMRAGYYNRDSALGFLAMRNFLLTILFGLAGFAFFGLDHRPDLKRLVMAMSFVIGVFCYALPRFLLRMQASSRVARIQRGLPDALDMVTMCLSGGLPMLETFSRVQEEIAFAHPDVSMEFDIIRRQSEAGSMAQALKQFAQRIDIPEVRSLSAIVGQTERLGTNVAKSIRDYCDNLRRAHRQSAEEKAGKSTIKMLFPVIFCLAPPVYILLLAPPIMQLRDFIVKENQPGGALSPTVNLRDLSAPPENE